MIWFGKNFIKFYGNFIKFDEAGQYEDMQLSQG